MGKPISEKLQGTWNKIFLYNPIANRWFDKKRKEILNREFLESDRYDKLFLKGVNDVKTFRDFRQDAQDKTTNFMFRHFRMGRALGSWRWKGVWLNRKDLIPIIYKPDTKGIDFGGGAGPITLESVVVDFLDKDIFGREVRYKDLKQVDFKADFIFSSHTLEHIEDLEPIFAEFKRILKPGGDLILNLPSWTCIRWHAGVHSHRQFNDHKWTFFLKDQPPNVEVPSPKGIDEDVEKHFEVYRKEYTGDDSILIFAKNR